MLKNIIKLAISYSSTIIVLPLILLTRLSYLISSSESMFVFAIQTLSLIPGVPGNYLRKAYLRYTTSHCHTDCSIGFLTLFSHRDTEIHQNVYIGPQCNIGKSKIEKGCLLGSAVHILSGSGQHNFDDLNTPIQEQGGHFQKITIGEDTWIGNNSLIMADVGKKCVIGAGSVVTKPLPDYSIAAGNPAKVLKDRKAS